MRTMALFLVLWLSLPAFASTQFKCEKVMGEPGVIVEMEISHDESTYAAEAKLISGAWTKMAEGSYTELSSRVYAYNLHMRNDQSIAVAIQLVAIKDGNYNSILSITDKAEAKFTCVALN